MSCHLKRGFGRSDFLLKYHQNPQVLKRWSIEKKEKKKKKKKKEKEQKKLQVSAQIKGELNILRGEKDFNFKESF
jgi:hypothetical protein